MDHVNDDENFVNLHNMNDEDQMNNVNE